MKALLRTGEATRGAASSERIANVAPDFAVDNQPAAETFFFATIIAISAIWETVNGTLPGAYFALYGFAIQGILWACFYTGLSLVYLAPVKNRESPRRVRRTLALCFVLALVSTHVCKLIFASFFGSQSWTIYFYLSPLSSLAFLAIWCSLLLFPDTREWYRAAQSNVKVAALPKVILLLALAAVLVSCGDLAFHWIGEGAVEGRLKTDIIMKSAWVTNSLILFSMYTLIFAATARVATAVLIVSPLYAVLGIATLAKIKYMHSAVQPLDLLRVPEFWPLIESFFGKGVVLGTVIAVAIWSAAIVASRRSAVCQMSRSHRCFMGLVSVVMLLIHPIGFAIAHSLPSVDAMLLIAGAPDGQWREKARRNGFLLSFLSEIPAAFISTPPNYSPAAVASTFGKYSDLEMITEANSHRQRVNLIIYMVESLMDPDDLGLRYTTDPMPTMRALRKTHISGYAIVPNEFGGSSTTEFETLTGMSQSFLPDGSVPYRQYLNRPIPSLPRTLQNLGYTTIAIQADPKYYYARERAYELLGFDKVVWLAEAPGVERAKRGHWPSDEAVVEAVIDATQRARPFFLFAFPTSTHSPYTFGTYRDSELDIINGPTTDKVGELKEYINAIRVADRAIAKLIQHFRFRPEHTIIVILGDHLPPLSTNVLHSFSTNLSTMSKAERDRRTRRVPLLVWANFALHTEQMELSTNALPSYLLERMSLVPTHFLGVTNAVRLKIPVLSTYAQTADGKLWKQDSLREPERALVKDYQLLQYDLLLGKQYSLRDSVAGSRPSSGASALAIQIPNSR